VSLKKTAGFLMLIGLEVRRGERTNNMAMSGHGKKSKETGGFHVLIGLEVRFGQSNTGLDRLGETTNSVAM
jgi:hypothetical protein